MQGIKHFPGGVEFGVYFHTLGVVVLTGPGERFSDTPSQGGSEAFEVDRVRTWGEVERVDGENGDEGEKEEGIDEPLLQEVVCSVSILQMHMKCSYLLESMAAIIRPRGLRTLTTTFVGLGPNVAPRHAEEG